jgi:hypothetical protein
LALAALEAVRRAATPAALGTAGVVLALAAPAAVLVRGNGLALAPALAVALFLVRGPGGRGQRWWLAAALLLVLATFGAWTAWGAFHQFQAIHNVTYLQEVRAVDLEKLWEAGGLGPRVERVSAGGLVTRVYRNVVWYQLYRIDGLFWPQADQLAEARARGVGLLLAGLALVPFVVGSVSLARRSPPVFTYLAFSLLITVVYPTGGAARMLLPVLPVLLVAFYLGLEFLLGRDVALGWATCVLFANLILCAVQADLQARHPYDGTFTNDTLALIRDDVPRQTAPGDVVLTDYHLVVTAFADRASVPPSKYSWDDRAAGSVYLLEMRSRPFQLPDNFSREVVVTRGEAQLSRVKEARSR